MLIQGLLDQTKQPNQSAQSVLACIDRKLLENEASLSHGYKGVIGYIQSTVDHLSNNFSLDTFINPIDKQTTHSSQAYRNALQQQKSTSETVNKDDTSTADNSSVDNQSP